MFGKDTRSYEVQLIEAVRSVNRSLGGTTARSAATYNSSFNQYEVQLIDAVRSIARTLSGTGLSLAGGGIGNVAGLVSLEEFQALSRRVSVLESESFFRLVDGNVTLKEDYENLWVPGWFAAGGIGEGGGGSIVSVTQVLGSGTKIATITIDGVDTDLYAPSGGGGGGGGNSVAWGSTTDNKVGLTVDGVEKYVLLSETDPTVPSWAKESSKPSYTFSEIGSKPTTIAGYGITDAKFGTDGTDYVPVTLGATTKNVLTSHQSLSDYALKTGGIAYNFQVASLILSNGTLSAYTGSGFLDERIRFTFTDNSSYPPSVTSKVLAYVTDIPSSLKNPYSLTFGSKSYDGSSAKTILASDLGAVTLTDTQTISGAKTFTADLTASANLLVGGKVSVNGKESIDQSSTTMALFNYGARASKTFNAYGTGISLRACDSNGDQVNILAVTSGVILAGKTLRPNYNATGVNLGADTADGGRWGIVYGVSADLTGHLSMPAASYIDIGPLRITYDSQENAAHITSNDGSTINLYCDGYISAGGIQQSS